MAHKRLESLREKAVLHDRMGRLFEDGARAIPPAAQTWMPPVDMYETADTVVICAEIPGVEQKGVKIELSENYITISGARSAAKGKEKFLRVERSQGPFLRTFRIPARVIKEEVSAEYRQGVLRITVKKHEGANPAYVQVAIE